MADDNEIEKVEKELDVILQNRNDDYEYGRDLLYATAERLQEILESAVGLAQESEHPRAIEVATNTATALAGISSSLMDHHLRVEKLNKSDKDLEKNVTNNNLNIKMSTKDLLELLSKD